MMAWRAMVIGAFALAIALNVHASSQQASTDPYEADIAAADKALDAGKCDQALPLIRRIIASPPFADAPDKMAALVWAKGVDCALDQKLWEEAFRDARAGTRYPDAPDELWRERFELGMFLNRPDDVVETAELLVHIRPAIVSKIDFHQIGAFADKLRKTGAPTLRRRLFAAMVQADYHPPNPFDAADAFWLAYAGMLAADGELDAARAVLARLQGPNFLETARLDGRFARLVAASPERFDVRAAAARQLVADQAAAQAHPELAAGVVAVALDLRRLGRGGEALAIVEDAQAKVAKATSAPAFTDLDDQANWLADERADDLGDQGRFEERVAAMREAAEINEGGGRNVSQLINLAGALTAVNRPLEALDVLKAFGPTGEGRHASAYGVMWMMKERACAYAQLGDTGDLSATLKLMSEHEIDNQAALTAALICAGDLNGTAASYVRRLADADARRQALLDLSDFSDKPPMTPFEIELNRRAGLVANRPDVKAAVGAVGRVEVIPLREGSL